MEKVLDTDTYRQRKFIVRRTNNSRICINVFNSFQDCSKIIENEDATLSFPEYQDNKECVIVARTSAPKSVVQLKFLTFEMEEYDNCIFDSLTIYTGERNGNGLSKT